MEMIIKKTAPKAKNMKKYWNQFVGKQMHEIVFAIIIVWQKQWPGKNHTNCDPIILCRCFFLSKGLKMHNFFLISLSESRAEIKYVILN